MESPTDNDPPQLDRVDRLQSTVAETALAAGIVGCTMADIAGTIEDVRIVAQSQTKRFASVTGDMISLVSANQRIGAEAAQASESALATRVSIEGSLNSAVGKIESGLSAVGRSLDDAFNATNEIAQVALQTRMVALNAAVQAAHAGAQGQSFAVVADSVREMAQQIQASSKTIANTLGNLTLTVRSLIGSDRGRASGEDAGLRASVEDALKQFRCDFDTIANRIDVVASSAAKNVVDCDRVNNSVRAMADEVASLKNAVDGAATKSVRLLGVSERLIEITANSGALTDDTPFIECACQIGAEMSQRLENALDSGAIDDDSLFDERYVPIPNTDPQQFMTRFVPLTDRLFTEIQEEVLRWSARVIFCAAVDRNGFLPTHNVKYSKPQRADKLWNTANCRNRRIFDDRTGLAAGRNVKPFLLQTYRRDMGGGNFLILKEADAPIWAGERQWGNVRLAFLPTGTV
jgi:methyl-accepting chemotaxis protein